MFSPEEQRVLASIDEERLVGRLREMVAFPTSDGNEDAAQLYLEREMRCANLKVDQWEIDVESLRSHPAFGVEVEHDRPIGLVGRLGGQGGGRSLILNGHVDVVPPGDLGQWSVKPFELTRRDGWLFGRGALDMKGGVCSAFEAVQAVMDSGVRLKGDVLLQTVIGEEDGGLGTLAAIERGYRADGAIVPEPTSLRIATVQAGCLGFRLHVPGLSAHGCLRTEGVSAIEKFSYLHQALLDFEGVVAREGAHPMFPGACPYPLSVGTVQSGEWSSSVPDSLVATGRYGVPPDWSMGEAKAKFESAVSAACDQDAFLRENRAQVEWWGGFFEPGSTDSDDPLVTELLVSAADVLDSAPKLVGVPYGSDLRLLSIYGDTPTVLFGAGDVRRAHGPDECVRESDLLSLARTLAVAICRFCGVV